jgi:hypothetical protein
MISYMREILGWFFEPTDNSLARLWRFFLFFGFALMLFLSGSLLLQILHLISI